MRLKEFKWLFVDVDYQGFDVRESKARTKQWIDLRDVDRARIGRKSFWEQQVLPRLTESAAERVDRGEGALHRDTKIQCERWVRGEEARKLLRLSTCDLSHYRESGKIRFKKEGRAFLYFIEDVTTPGE